MSKSGLEEVETTGKVLGEEKEVEEECMQDKNQ